MTDPPPPTPPDPPLPKRRATDDSVEEPADVEVSPAREAYNVVSDTVTGVNFRRSDNCLQAVWILVSLILGVGIGAIFAVPEGLFIGGFIGLLVGLFSSGVFLMIYRAVRHISGKHD